MQVYLITHGERMHGFDPTHTGLGLSQIGNIRLPLNICLIICGTGRRFTQILRIVKRKLPHTAVKYSPFCGSGEGIEENGTRVLSDNTIVASPDFLGITKGIIDMWQVVAFFKRFCTDGNMLICAGGELMVALGLGEINQKGHLYRLDCSSRTGEQII